MDAPTTSDAPATSVSSETPAQRPARQERKNFAPAETRTSVSRADRFMLRLLRIKDIDRTELAGAHRAFRWAIVFSAVRCTITYLLVPLLAPIISIAGALATPISITLCLAAVLSGTLSLRRFWRSDHRGKWAYTWFIAVVFLIVIGTLGYEITGLVTG